MSEHAVVVGKVLEHLRRSWWKEMADDISRAIGEPETEVLLALNDLMSIGKISHADFGYAVLAEPLTK